MSGPTRQRRIFRVSTASVLLGLAAAVSGCITATERSAQPVYQAQSPAPAQNNLRLVPYVKDMPVQRAKRALQREGFRLGRVTYEINRRYAPDTVLHQIPRANARARPGSPVDLVVAEAHARAPDLQGLHLGQARQALREAGLRLGEVRREHSRHGRPETVIDQRPQPSARVAPDSAVDIVIAQPGRRSGVPNVVGLKLPQARQVLRDAGYREGGVSERSSKRERPGTVLSQSPEAGARDRRQAPVDLVVAARTAHSLPRLKGMTLPEARATLDRLGLQVGKVTRKAVQREDPGTVLSQSPRPSTQVTAGAGVDLVVAKAPDTVGRVEVPSLLGLQSTAAVARLKKAGLRVGLMRSIRDDKHPLFSIIQQNPEPGTLVKRGTKVDFAIVKSER